MAITVGLCVGYFTCYGTVNINSSISWRLPFALQAGIAAFLALVAELYLPPSPRWLTHRKRPEEAIKAWERLGVSEFDREETVLEEIRSDTNHDLTSPASVTLKMRFKRGVKSLKRLITTEARNPMFLGIFLMSMQQLSGIDGVLYVSHSCSSAVIYLVRIVCTLTLRASWPFII